MKRFGGICDNEQGAPVKMLQPDGRVSRAGRAWLFRACHGNTIAWPPNEELCRCHVFKIGSIACTWQCSLSVVLTNMQVWLYRLQMTNPAVQNDFSYYRRTLSRMRMAGGVSIHVAGNISPQYFMIVLLWLKHNYGIVLRFTMPLQLIKYFLHNVHNFFTFQSACTSRSQINC